MNKFVTTKIRRHDLLQHEDLLMNLLRTNLRKSDDSVI